MEKVVPKIGLFLCDQGGRLSRTIDVNAMAGKFAKAKNVVRCEVVNDVWDPPFLDSIKKDVESSNIDRILWVGRFTQHQIKHIEGELAATGLNVYLHEWCDLEEQGIRHRRDRSRGSQTQGRIPDPDVPCTNPFTGSPGACRVARLGRDSHYRSGSGGNSHCGHPRGARQARSSRGKTKRRRWKSCASLTILSPTL